MSSRRTASIAANHYPASVYSLDDEQLFSISASLIAPEMNSRNLDDVPEEESSALENGSCSPYTNPSAANSASTFHNGVSGSGGGSGGPSGSTTAAPTPAPSTSRPRKTPSVRTLGRSSNDQLQALGSSSGNSVRRTASSSSTAPKTTRPAGVVGNPTGTLQKYRSTPRLPHDKDAAPAPTTGMHWSKAPVWGAIPARTLRAHTVTLLDTTAWVLGGSDDKDTSKDIYCFDTETMQWTHPDTVGDIPPPCRAHTATLVDRKIVIYGGGLGSQYYDTVYILDTTTRRWTQPVIHDGPHPAGRRAHTAVFYKNKVWIFGGGNGLTALNDIWTLELGPNQAGVVDGPKGERALRWEEREATGKKPGPRGYHTATLVGHMMVVVGGSDGKECFTDVWLLNLDILHWSMVKQTSPLYKRLSHSATQVGSYLFILAGHNGADYCSEILLFNLVSLQYEGRTIYGKPPSIRGNHATILADSRVFLFGGFNGQCAFDDVYILDLAAGAYLPQVTSFVVEA